MFFLRINDGAAARAYCFAWPLPLVADKGLTPDLKMEATLDK
jgi:hypothetical protein